MSVCLSVCLAAAKLTQSHRCDLTVMDNALVQKLLHDLDGRVPVHGLLVLDEPVEELLGHKAVGVRAQVVPPVLDHLPFMEPQPGRRPTGRQKKTAPLAMSGKAMLTYAEETVLKCRTPDLVNRKKKRQLCCAFFLSEVDVTILTR